MVALGKEIAGLLGNDEELVDAVRAAGTPGRGAVVAAAASRGLRRATSSPRWPT